MKHSIISVLLSLLFLGAAAQWPSDHTQNLKLTNIADEQVIPKIARSPNGNYYVGYFSLENGNYVVRLQLLSSQGNILWQNNGILVSSHPSMTWLTDWDMTADADNHAVLVWQDIRTGNNNIVAYRISPDGQFVWGPDGILLSNNSGFNVAPKVAALPGGDVVVAWQSTSVIYRQRLNPQGQKLWGEQGLILSSLGNTLSWPQLLPAGDDDIFMKYYIDSGPAWAPVRKLYVRRFNAQGADVWTGATEIFNLGNITAWTQILPMLPDGNGGFYITWHDYSFNGNAATPRVNQVSGSGQLVFGVNGLPTSLLHSSNQFNPIPAKIAGDNNIYSFWQETNMDQNLWGVIAQKTAPDGTMLWGETGKEIIPVTSQNVRHLYLEAESDGIVIFFDHAYSTTQSSLRAIKVNSNGEPVWNQPAIISSPNSTKGKAVFAPFSGGQWVLAWEDNRTGDIEIFAQNMKDDGSLGPVPPTGILNRNNKEQVVRVIPNPANNDSRIVFENPVSGPYQIEIRDASGKVIGIEDFREAQQSLVLKKLIKTDRLIPGIYLLKVTIGGQSSFSRFVVN